MKPRLAVRNRKVKNISNILGYVARVGTIPHLPREQAIEFRDEQDWAENELYNICMSTHELYAVIKSCQMIREDLNMLYRTLIREGAGQWRGGYYVPVASFLDANTLRYCLKVISAQSENEDAQREMAYNLLMYFDRKPDEMFFNYTERNDIPIHKRGQFW